MTNRIVQPRLELADLVQALALERLVADGQDLVDQQDVGADVDGHREPEAHVLAGAVVLDLVVDERLQLGEGDDVVEVALGLPAGQAEDGRVQVDVLAAGELAVEAGPQLQQRRDPARTVTVPVVGAEDARQHLEQRRLARAVGADQPDGLAGADLQVHVPQGPELLGAGLAVQQQPLLEAGGPLVVEQEALADPGGADRRGRPLQLLGEVGLEPAEGPQPGRQQRRDGGGHPQPLEVEAVAAGRQDLHQPPSASVTTGWT